MTYSTKPELRKAVTGFLKQRIKACEIMRYQGADSWWYAHELTARRLLNKWNMIRTYGYWRHCLEIATHHRDFIAILPAKSAGHRHIRQHVLDMIAWCCWASSQPKEQIDAEYISRASQSH